MERHDGISTLRDEAAYRILALSQLKPGRQYGLLVGLTTARGGTIAHREQWTLDTVSRHISDWRTARGRLVSIRWRETVGGVFARSSLEGPCVSRS